MGLLQATLHNKATIPAGGFHLRGAVAPRMYIYFDLPKSWTSVQGNLRTALEVPPHVHIFRLAEIMDKCSMKSEDRPGSLRWRPGFALCSRTREAIPHSIFIPLIGATGTHIISGEL